jgi:hypothetical protein
MIREYKTRKAFYLEADRLGTEGWHVENVAEVYDAPGLLRTMALGVLRALWKPHPQLIVTYRRREPDGAP